MLCLVPGKTVLVTVSSSGPAAVIQSAFMGVFIMTAQLYNGHPVYNKTDGGPAAVIFVNHYGRWGISDRLNPSLSHIGHLQLLPTPSHPPTTGWDYGDGYGPQPDPGLTVVARGIGYLASCCLLI